MFLDFTRHHRYKPRPVAVARGNQKGRVERAIRYVRTSFWPARESRDLDELNRRARAWCTGEAADRPCLGDPSLLVRDAFALEQPKRRAVPEKPYPTDDREEMMARKTPYVRFDCNDDSIPHDRIGRTITIVANLDRVRILDGAEVTTDHERSFYAKQQIQDPSHIAALQEKKRRARKHCDLARLARAVSSAPAFLELVARRGGNLVLHQVGSRSPWFQPRLSSW